MAGFRLTAVVLALTLFVLVATSNGNPLDLENLETRNFGK